MRDLAPSPDFRYVGLQYGPGGGGGVLSAAIGIGTSVVACASHNAWSRAAWAVAAATACATTAFLASGRRQARREAARTGETAIVPWGLLVESTGALRVLHWAAIRRVQLDMVHGRDGGTPTTRYSLVTLEGERENFVGCVVGAASLERLVVYLEDYAREAGHAVALDLGGEVGSSNPLEPDCESLLLAVRAWLDSASASQALELPSGGYRRVTMHSASARALDVLGDVLRDRTAHAIDPRAFAAVVAAELGALPLADELVALVQSPHPVIAAVAKVAARKLGVPTSRIGVLDEVAPFLSRGDVDVLAAWGGATGA